jgi:hypothetical protein
VSFDPRAALARQQEYEALRVAASPSDHASETARVMALPSCTDTPPDLTERYRSATGAWSLRPIQSSGLWHAERTGGLIGPVGVGGGKGLLTMLLPHALRSRRPLLLLPANLLETFHMEYRKFKPHFNVATNLKVLTYSALSVASGADFLNRYQPDLIIGDEAHNLRHPESTRTKRLLRYSRAFPETRHCYLSGTLTKRGLRDYAHLAELALGPNAPLPLDLGELLAWANCVDADGRPSDGDWRVFAPMLPEWEEFYDENRKARGRDAFMTRFRSSFGVVASDESQLGVSLYFRERSLEEPDAIREARLDLRQTWCRPDGEELVSALEVYRVESQMSSGFYYVWDWPDGIVDEEWMEKRASWHKAVRRLLKRNDPQYDSPMRVALGVARGTLRDSEAAEAYVAWCGVKDRPRPPTRAVWLSDFLVRWAGEWALERLAKKEPGIVWYEHTALGEALGALGLPVYGPGRDPQTARDSVLAASITAHGTGKNLQRFAHSLVVNWPSSGTVVEQLVGRMHRPGQLADEVVVEYPAHTPQARNALRRSRTDARYIEATLATAQKVNYGTWTHPVSEEEE